MRPGPARASLMPTALALMARLVTEGDPNLIRPMQVLFWEEDFEMNEPGGLRYKRLQDCLWTLRW